MQENSCLYHSFPISYLGYLPKIVTFHILDRGNEIDEIKRGRHSSNEESQSVRENCVVI